MEIELVQGVDLVLLRRLVKLEADTFGTGGLNEWHLVPLIRHGRVYIAKENQTAVGLIQYMRDWNRPHRAYLSGVSIAREARGRGLGTKLIRASLQALGPDDIKEVELTVAPDNKAAIRVYEKLGFATKGLRIDEYGAGENRLVMVLLLSELS